MRIVPAHSNCSWRPIRLSLDLLLAQTQYEDSIQLGQIIIAVSVGFAALVGIFYGAKWKVIAETARAAADELRKSLGDSQDREKDKEAGLREQSEVNSQLRERIKVLEQQPDFTQLVALFKDTYELLDSGSATRHERLLDQVRVNTDALKEIHAELKKANGQGEEHGHHQ